MLATLLRIGWISLKRDRVVQALTFLLPIMFFSIFAMVFSQQSDPTSRVRVAIVDEDQSDYSRKVVEALSKEGGLRVTLSTEGETPRPLTRADGEALVRGGTVPVAIVLPKGIGGLSLFAPAASDPSGAEVKVQLLADVSDPVAPQVVSGLLQKVAFTAAPATMAVEGMAMFEKFGGAMTPQQQQIFNDWQADGGQFPEAEGEGSGGMGIPVEIVNVLKPDEGDTATVSFYAAGIGVMFLLFSCAGAGGSLLEEEEAGTLDRLIGSRLGMTGVLAGKWVFLVLLGIAQLTVMFVWGALMFGLPLWDHVPGFLIMTTATACAAAAFGLVLATASRTRAQLSGMSTIIILSMSAVGGSMFPRFMMSESMQQMGLVTFNAWALDGYLKVFWYDAPLLQLWPQVAVLLGLAATFFVVARRLGRRWEAV
jgi:ABC-2 type transport system permease protein